MCVFVRAHVCVCVCVGVRDAAFGSQLVKIMFSVMEDLERH